MVRRMRLPSWPSALPPNTSSLGPVSLLSPVELARAGERDGVDYHFVDTKEFLRLTEADAFLEHAEYSGNLAATLFFPLGEGNLFLRTDYSYMDDHDNGETEDDRELVNSRLGWRNDNWTIAVWGRNLTDDEYATQTVTTFAFTGMDAFFLAPPRTYGATIRYDL